jgi:large subunit ribosomal protein L10
VALQRETKRKRAIQQIEAIRAVAKTAHMAATVWYRGLDASELYQLRVSARQLGVYIKIVRNTLAHRALEGTTFACLQPVLEGPVLLAFSLNEPASVARLLRDFSKGHSQLIVKHLAFEGQLLGAQDLGNMANLPSREEAVARLLSVLHLPAHNLVRVLKEPSTRLIRVLDARGNC